MIQSPALSILQISDCHILPNAGETMLGIDTEHYFRSVLEHAHQHRKRYDLILISGDLAQEPCRLSYQRMRDWLEYYQTECICLPGNHDDAALMQEVLCTEHISCRAQRMFEHWQLLCLNSQIPKRPGGRLAKSELEFLEAKLKSRPDLFTIVAFHHHCLPSRSAWLDTMIIENSRALLAILERYPQVKVVTTGHVHQEMDITKQLIRFLSAPSTCFQFKPDSTDFRLDTTMPGYRLLELFPDGQVRTRVQRLPGKLANLDNECHGY